MTVEREPVGLGTTSLGTGATKITALPSHKHTQKLSKVGASTY